MTNVDTDHPISFEAYHVTVGFNVIIAHRMNFGFQFIIMGPIKIFICEYEEQQQNVCLVH